LYWATYQEEDGLSEYTISVSDSIVTVTDSVANRDGVDTLHNMEWLQFADQTVTAGGTPTTTTLIYLPI